MNSSVMHNRILANQTAQIQPPSIYVESKPGHAAPILRDHVLTVLLRVVAIGEEHAFIAGRLFIFAHATGLTMESACHS